MRTLCNSDFITIILVLKMVKVTTSRGTLFLNLSASCYDTWADVDC